MPVEWLREDVMLAVHQAQLAEHGGSAGVRDFGLLQSALARPRNLAEYGTPDLADLAAAYGMGIARNHPFIDGNKRAALVAMEVFLDRNGASLVATDEECVQAMVSVAGGTCDEAALAGWLRARIT